MRRFIRWWQQDHLDSEDCAYMLLAFLVACGVIYVLFNGWP